MAKKHISPADWAIIRILAESRKYNHQQIARRFGLSKAAIDQRSSDEKWRLTRKKTQAAIQERVEESTAAALARLGMPKDERLKLIIAGAKKTMMLTNVKQVAKDRDGNVLRTSNGSPAVIEQTIRALDNGNTREYRKELVKLAGDYAPPRVPVDAKGKESQVVQHVYNITDPKQKDQLEAIHSGADAV